ncbi:MAG: glycosyltransferase [Candidatus Sumerlaeia bacterium]|nr:glycosyltransferase [Candidatus Sumerlaeia bacterium]
MQSAEYIFLVESPHSWGGVWQRPHHLFRLLARDYPCFYVATRYLRDACRKPAEYLKGIQFLHPAENLSAREIILFNGERFSFIRNYNLNHLADVLNRFARRHPHAKKILWLYDPHQVGIIDLVPHNLLVYDIMDEYTGFPWSPATVAVEEQRLLAQADVVIAGTYTLYEAKKPLVKKGKIDWVLSAVDFDHFHKSAIRGTLPPEMQQLQNNFKYIAGYFGVVDMRIDTALIQQTATFLNDWAFVFIGPEVGKEISTLKNLRLKNVFFLGPRHYSTLPEYTRAFNVCLIPFVINRLTQHINPTKILEYFAAARPVVSCAIPDVERFYREVALIYKSPAEFITALQTAVSSPEVSSRITHGVELARTASWTSAVDKIKRLIFFS